MSEDSAEIAASLGDVLTDGEQVVVAAEGLMRTSGVAFDKCRVVLTQGRFIVLKAGWPWGFKVDRSIPRDDCRVKTTKERFDGSQLLVVSYSGGDVCLYFGRAEAGVVSTLRANFAPRGEADVIVSVD